jgi:hypothetical protein
MNTEDELRRAGKAGEILNNELWKDAFNEIEKALVEGIARTAFTDEKLREKLAQRLACLHDVRRQLESHIETGKLAKTMLERAMEKVKFT